MHKLFLAVMEQVCFHHVLKIPALLDLLIPHKQKARALLMSSWSLDFRFKEVKGCFFFDEWTYMYINYCNFNFEHYLKVLIFWRQPSHLIKPIQGRQNTHVLPFHAFHGPTDEAGGSIRGRDKRISLGAWTVMSGINTHHYKPRTGRKSIALSRFLLQGRLCHCCFCAIRGTGGDAQRPKR